MITDFKIFESRRYLDRYFLIAKKAYLKNVITNLTDIEYDENGKYTQFTFEYPDDNCRCIVYYENHSNSVVLYQKYNDESSDSDDISFEGFKKYLNF
jgi:hypothetical protein